ncbi:MAG: glutamate racemase [Candidatus Cloacimonetes bacterium]|jgi:glutamate racemase|nr:glutamate racemase [Candidatus Cloacimonadota bacterium]MDD4155659.1 glutamate racemase [Candidatus Cloacimonadota bacterium]
MLIQKSKDRLAPIGIFDSGVGGLTVFKEVRKTFPYENIVYFGDTARVPYGPKSDNTVIEYSIQNARFLIQLGVKIIIIACNTSSAVALDRLQDILQVPVLGVIQPGAETAVNTTKNGKIGVIGTEGTIRSKAYTNAIKSIDNQIEIFEKACPLFVSLAEEGWHRNKVSYDVAEIYLRELVNNGIDTLVLGCTHYPILKNIIQDVCGSEITLVDSSIAIQNHLKDYLPVNNDNITGKDYFFVSDNEEKFNNISKNILNICNFTLKKVKLGESWYID